MQADWTTIQAIAATKAIDVWILFPFAVNRLLTRNPKDLQPGWRERLNRVFGSEEWYNRFYVERRIEQFFGEPETVVEKNLTLAGLAAYYKERLQSVFPMVAPNPRILRNTRNAPLFQLFFAASNPGNGGKIAVKIARHILEKI
jgi:three-Cys-motif partner protein